MLAPCGQRPLEDHPDNVLRILGGKKLNHHEVNPMPPRLVGNSVPERKSCLADLVVEHLSRIDENGRALDGRAEVLRNRQNSRGHTDQVVVNSPRFGLIHVMALSGADPNGSIPFHREGTDHDWLADKAYVAFGWNALDGRTLIHFVEAETVRETPPMNKESVRQVATGQLTATFWPQPNQAAPD